MASVLGQAVFSMVADTRGLARGINQAMGMVTGGLGSISAQALASSNKMSQGLGMIGVAATIANASVAQLVTGMTGLMGVVNIASSSIDQMHNLEQTFGTATDSVTEAINRQSEAFGHSKTQLAGFADTLGRELQTAGVLAGQSAEVTEAVIAATSRLAASRRITPEAAFQQIKGGTGLFSKDQVRVVAMEKGLLATRNQELLHGNELLARYYLATREVFDSTEGIAQATQTWSGQLQALGTNIENLAVDVGTDLAPAFEELLEDINAAVKGLTTFFHEAREGMKGFAVFLATGSLEEARRQVGAEEQARKTSGVDQAAIDARNNARAERNRQEQLMATAMRQGFGGFRGSAAGLHDAIQDRAWQANQLQQLKAQNEKQERLINATNAVKAAIEGRNKDNATF